MEQGTVVRMKTGFGFIQRAGKSDMHFAFSSYPRGQKPAEGDVLEFEIHTDASKPEGRQETAVNIRIVTKGSGKPGSQPNIGLTGVFNYPKQPERTGDSFKLEVWVHTTPGAEVSLTESACEIDRPASKIQAGLTGDAKFQLWRTEDSANPIVSLAFAAKIEHAGKTVVVSDIWPPPPTAEAIQVAQAAAAAKSQVPQPNTLEVSQGGRVVGNKVTFVAKSGDKPCKGRITVVVSGGFTKLVNANDPTVESASSPVVWETNDSGVLTITIDTKEAHHTVKGSLANDQTKTAKTEVYDV